MVENKEKKFNSERLLSSFLVLSVLLNVFLVFHSNTLASQNSVLLTVMVAKPIVGSVSGVSTTIPASTDTQDVNIAILNDKRCVECDMTALIAKLKTVFPTASIKEIDYSEAEGKRLFDVTGVKLLPAVLFDDSVKTSTGYAEISAYLKVAGSYQSLAIGAGFDPTKEICNNNIDDNNNGLIDCADSDCVSNPVCRSAIANKVDLFVMSKCPYGVQAMDSLKEVLSVVKNVNLSINYIASADPVTGSFVSLHGQTEVDEDLRELCVMKYYPKSSQYMEYIWCRNKDIQSTAWESCATSNNMDVVKISTCATGEEGKKLLRDSIAFTDSVGVQASPSWMANNKYMFSALAAEEIKTNVCKYNVGLGGCDKTLSGATAATTSAASCNP
jgi:hypothetical protein